MNKMTRHVTYSGEEINSYRVLVGKWRKETTWNT